MQPYAGCGTHVAPGNPGPGSPTQFPLGSESPPQVRRTGGLAGAPRAHSVTSVRAMTANAIARTQRFITARCYGAYVVPSLVLSCPLHAVLGQDDHAVRRDADQAAAGLIVERLAVCLEVVGDRAPELRVVER